MKSINKQIIQLAIPNIVSNITVPLLGLVDLSLMGHLGSDIYIGAVSLGTVVFNIIYWGFAFLRMSTSGFTAQAYGEKNKTEAITILFRALLVTFALSLAILLFKNGIAGIGFSLIDGSAEVEKLATEYFNIRIWAAPAALSLFVFNGWFLGMQNARYPMILAILVNGLNILLSFIFVVGLGMKSDGVALGTAIAQYTGLIAATFLLLKKYAPYLPLLSLGGLKNLKFLIRFFKVNSDIFIRTLCIIFVFTFFTSKSAGISDTVLAVNSLLLQFLMFFSFFIDGFAFAGEALVGKYYGAGDAQKLKSSVKLLLLWGLALASTFTLIYLGSSKLILQLLTSQPNVLEAAQDYLIWVIFIPFASVGSFVWDGVYIGATASRPMRNSLLFSTLFIFIPIFFALHRSWGNHALWLSMLLFMFSRGIILASLFNKTIVAKIR